MRTLSIASLLAVLSAFALTAQTPAPGAVSAPAPGAVSAPALATGKPLRHLVFTFSVDTGGVAESHYNGIGNGVETSSGVGASSLSEGGHGTMTVDVFSITADGALNVQISEFVQNEPRPRQTYACTVYGNTAVVCPSVPAPSEAEWVLLSYLGRSFVDAAPWDANHHWQRKENGNGYVLVEDFTMTGPSDAKSVPVHETKKIEIHNAGFDTRTEEVNISYNRAMEVPDSIHDELQEVAPSGSRHTVFDFTLSDDSFRARFASPAPH
jgi:hypothetical protein